MNIQFGQIDPVIMLELQQVNQICSQHKECKDCPMLENKGIHMPNSIVVCDKLMESNNEM